MGLGYVHTLYCPLAGSSRGRERANVEIRSAHGKRSFVRLPPCQMQEIGLLRADGSAVVGGVTVTLRMLSGGDAQGGEPSDGAVPATSKDPRTDNEDDAGESQSPRYALVLFRGVSTSRICCI